MRHSGHGDHGVSHLCYSIIIILMASMVAAVGCSAAEGALIFSITAIGSLVASVFIGPLLKVLKTKYVYVIGGILQGALLVTMGYSTNLMLVYVMAFLFGVGNQVLRRDDPQINVTNWFASGRGTISSMGTLVSGLLNAVMATVTGVLQLDVRISDLFAHCGLRAGWHHRGAWPAVCLRRSRKVRHAADCAEGEGGQEDSDDWSRFESVRDGHADVETAAPASFVGCSGMPFPHAVRLHDLLQQSVARAGFHGSGM